MSQNRGHIFFEKSLSLATTYSPGDDPRTLQLAFSGLFDEAAQAICRAGSDLDEVLVERILVVRRNHKVQCEIPAKFLSDAGLLKKSVLDDLAVSADSAEADTFDIVGVKIIARRDELPG